MQDGSPIERIDTTWNPTRGCTPVSPGCERCYAEAFARRWRGIPEHPYEQGFDLRLVPEKLFDPLHWARPRTAFVGSMSDLFHERVPAAFVGKVFGVMRLADWHVYPVLTKRADRMKKLLSSSRHRGLAELEHIWLGVSVEDRRHGLPRIQRLREAPVAKRFLALEPLLEDLGTLNLSGIDWVIVGGETGWGARPMKAEWVRSIRRQCRKARIPFTLKGRGGVQRSEEVRQLDGRYYDERPAVSAPVVPEREERKQRLEGARKKFGSFQPA